MKINGKYYHFDATFDNTLGKGEALRYDYFCVGDKQIFKDHEPVLWKIPECADSDTYYYREKKLSFTKYEDVRKRIAQAVKKGKTFTFHWRGGYLTKDVIRELFQIFEEEAEKKQKHAFISLNWAQAVMQVSFREQISAEQVVMEEANEGEKYENG